MKSSLIPSDFSLPRFIESRPREFAAMRFSSIMHRRQEAKRWDTTEWKYGINCRQRWEWKGLERKGFDGGEAVIVESEG